MSARGVILNLALQISFSLRKLRKHLP